MGKTILQFKRDLYSKEAVMKAAYHFIDRCYIHVNYNNDEYTVELTGKTNSDLDHISKEFENELLAQSVRQIVYRQTHTIREILMARAMASTITGGNLDELGDIEPDGTDKLEDILMDWFEKNEK